MRKVIFTLIFIAVAAFVSVADDTAPAGPSAFSWGADIGGAIDLGGDDMSTADIDAYFGYRSGAIDLLGIGVGMHMMVNNSNRTFPVYALLRTNFVGHPTVCFLDLRVGCAFSQLSDDSNQSRLYLSPSIGFNLATGRTFKSYVTLGYQFNDVRSYGVGEDHVHLRGLHMACVRFGVSF